MLTHLAESGPGNLVPIIVIVAIIAIVNGIKALARKAQAEQQRRSRESGDSNTVPSEEGRPRQAPADAVQQFLEEIARKSGVPLTQRHAAPASPPKARPAVATYQARQVRHAAPPKARPGRRARRPVPPPVAARVAHAVHEPPQALGAALKENGPETRETSAALRLDKRLPKDLLKRAIVLREVLAPPRAMNPHQPGKW